MSYRVHRYKKPSTEVNIITTIFKVLWFIVSAPFKLLFGKNRGQVASGGGLDRNFIQNKWQEVEQLVKLGRPSNYSRAVLEADKLLDHVLKGYRAPGMTMGDRLKASKNRFSPEGYDAAWKGHKVRNELVHNAQYELMDFQAKATISNFKRALDDLL